MLPQNDAPGPRQGEATLVCGDCAETAQGHPGLSSLPSSRPLPASRLLPRDTGCQSAPGSTAQLPLARAPEDGDRHGGHSSERRGPLPHVPLAFMLDWDHWPSGPLSEPQSQALLPLLTFLPLRPGLPSSPGLPWEEAEAVREPPRCFPQHRQLGVPGPHHGPSVQRGARHWVSPSRWSQLGLTVEGMGQHVPPGHMQVLASTYRDAGRSQGAHGARQTLLPTQPRKPLWGKEMGTTGRLGTCLPQPALGGGSVAWRVAPCRGWGTVPLCCSGPRSTGQDIGPLQAQWPQWEHKPNPPSPEVLTSRPGSPCFPGSPCRQGADEGRDTPALPQGPHEHPQPRAEDVQGGSSSCPIAPPSCSPHLQCPGEAMPPALDHTHPQPSGAWGARFAFQPIAAIQSRRAAVPL